MCRADDVNAFTKRISREIDGKRRSRPSLSLFLLLSDTPAVRRTVNASRCWPGLPVKKNAQCACSLTVHVRVIPVAEHRPVGQDLEVMSAIHAVEPGEPPAAERQAAVLGPLLGHTLLLIRHPAPGEERRPTGGPAAELGRLYGINWRVVYLSAVVRCLACAWTSAQEVGWASPTPRAGLTQKSELDDPSDLNFLACYVSTLSFWIHWVAI